MAHRDRWPGPARRRKECADYCAGTGAPRCNRHNLGEIRATGHLDVGFGVPDLLNDAAALGRLLAAGEADDLIAEIKGRIDDDSPEVQGNAIRALGFAHADGLAEDLGRVLGDDERSSVVRRHAAVGARQIGAHELLPLVVQRALTAGSVEVRTARYALGARRRGRVRDSCD